MAAVRKLQDAGMEGQKIRVLHQSLKQHLIECGGGQGLGNNHNQM